MPRRPLLQQPTPRRPHALRLVAFGLLSALTTLLVATPSQAATVAGGTYQETDPAVSFTGSWSAKSGTSGDLGGGFTSSSDATASASLTFTSTEVSWIGRTNTTSGLANVYIDGVLKASELNLYSSDTKYQQTIFKATGLANTTHTIKVVPLGRKNAPSSGSNVILDAFKVYDTTTPAAPTSLRATATRTGALVSWAAPVGVNVASYQLNRLVGTAVTPLATLDASTTSFDDIGLSYATNYTYSVTLTSATEKTSPAATVAFSVGAKPTETTYRYSNCPAPTATVSTVAQLNAAVAAAGPGSVIRVYSGISSDPDPQAFKQPITITANGTAAKPVWICGPRAVVLDFAGPTTNGGIKITNSSNLILTGMTVRDSQKGISVLYSDHVVVSDMRVEDIGQEAIHLKNQTTDSTVIGNSIARTGLQTTTYGEGVYVGTAQGNWCAYNDCNPDESNNDAVVGNDISGNTAEAIEAKEGAVNGRIVGNTVNGSTQVKDDADSPIAIQSSGWVVSDNTVTNSPQDGVQVWQVDAYGKNNLVFRNQFSGTIPGYSVVLAYNELGNVAGCDNSVASGSKGLLNPGKTCQA